MHRSDPFVGRREEIALIQRAADRARNGKAQFVMVEGLTGSGKTRLLHQAMESYPEWNERTILLDESFTAQPGSAIHHLLGADLSASAGLSGFTGTSGHAEVEDLLAAGFDAAQTLQRPYLLSVQNLHLVDEASADALWRALSLFQNGPVLVVLSTQASVRPEVQRLIQLAQASPRGTYISLQPLGLRDVSDLLEAYSSLPISDAVAARVMEETDGYPGLVEQVGLWLRRTPVGARSIDQALVHTVKSADYSGMHRDVLTRMNWLQDSDRRAVELLAAAEGSLSRSQIEAALSTTVDPAALLSTSLLSWEELTGRYAVGRRSLSRAVLSGTSEVERAGLLRSLAEVLEGEGSVRHLAEAIRLDPSLADGAQVIAELQAHARHAAKRHDFRDAFDHLMAAVSTDLDDVDSLCLLAGLAVRTDRVTALQELEPSMRALPPSTCRAGILALLMLEQSDTEAALFELESHRPEQDPGLPIYAEAVTEVSGRLLSESLRSRGAALAQDVSASLHAVLERPDGLDLVGYIWDRGYLLGLSALNTLWIQLSAERPQNIDAMIARASERLAELRGEPGVERFETALHCVRGSLLRQRGSMNDAYHDLARAAAQDDSSSYVMYARTQLALLLFSSGYWDEAAKMAERAAGAALLRREDAVSHVAYAVSLVVPAARGQVEKVRAGLERLSESEHAHGPLAAGTIDWVEACLAASQNDFRGVARNLLSMRDDSSAWWAMEPQAMSMLARALHLSGWAAMLPALLRGAESGNAVRDFQQPLTTPYLRGFERWAAGEPEQAMESLLQVLRGYDASETIRPTQPPGEGGGFRIFRAMLGLDIGALVSGYPVELARHRATALEFAVWSASVLQACGAETHLERANQLMETLRPRLLNEHPATRSHAAALLGPKQAPEPQVAEAERTAKAEPTLGADVEQALRHLSRRERQVTLLVSEGSTNREVAEQLVLSVRTVEYHVANAMTKLQVHSRREIRRLVRPR
ncbi:helix-turn-helix transcriptional regulator [Nesterenkonia halotolerans]|uniref:DNA-binding CsgD family transcriptional regulator n=1 Tax=Nesterenkonia halotolerans TaxID=225325 RepID=A0ABR9J4N6_9MICC|nr:LuxR C-terminal-related transcriptional regulator [Nesterenkonia halotolerans]MBE1513948.1 DNA-binding CsgD family transcriptional regulator [Nesterenkonia halotolerans]